MYSRRLEFIEIGWLDDETRLFLLTIGSWNRCKGLKPKKFLLFDNKRISKGWFALFVVRTIPRWKVLIIADFPLVFLGLTSYGIEKY